MQTKRIAVLTAAAAVILPFAVVVGVAIAAGGSMTTVAATADSIVCQPDAATIDQMNLPDWTGEQLDNAAIIYTVGAERGLPPRAMTIAIATAIQESGLRNLGHLGDQNDHDSLGLFQQRPSQGWGTPEQLTDPHYAAGKFYDKLLEVPGWEVLPLTESAQAVQRSAYPDAYARHETAAATLVAAFETGITCQGPTLSEAGFTHPLPGSLFVSGYRTPERPDHDGIDLATSPGTPILAAGPGTVVTVVCNAHTPDGEPYSCDIDGSPDILGCGWYLEIVHPDGTLTRYCHLLSTPRVHEGDTVRAGQQIGLVGSSGNSSGPHLHLETHVDYPASRDTSVEPIDYFAERGVQIGLAG